MEHDPTLRNTLTEILGTEAYINGTLDRAYIASKIFHDQSLLKKVEAVVHPAVTKEVERIFQDKKSGAVAGRIGIDIEEHISGAFRLYRADRIADRGVNRARNKTGPINPRRSRSAVGRAGIEP